MDKALILAAAIMLEAEGETFDGKAAVASVIWNNGGGSPSAMLDYVKSGKLSGYKARREDISWLVEKWEAENGEAWTYCAALGDLLVSGDFIATTSATHFFNPANASPAWAAHLVDVRDIGAHRFGRIKKGARK